MLHGAFVPITLIVCRSTLSVCPGWCSPWCGVAHQPVLGWSTSTDPIAGSHVHSFFLYRLQCTTHTVFQEQQSLQVHVRWGLCCLLALCRLPSFLILKLHRQAQAARQQRQRTSANLAEELLRQMRSGQGFNARNPSWQSPSSSKRRDYSNMGDGGPIIDAEWTTVDEDK